MATGLERIAYDSDISAGLSVSALWNTVVVTIVVSVVVVPVALLVSAFVVLLPVVILRL